MLHVMSELRAKLYDYIIIPMFTSMVCLFYCLYMKYTHTVPAFLEMGSSQDLVHGGNCCSYC